MGLVAESPAKMNVEGSEQAAQVVPNGSGDGQGGVTHEIVAVIEAAAEAFLGRKARILSIRMMEDVDGDSNAWASQGRNIIQTSHNLVQRGH